MRAISKKSDSFPCDWRVIFISLSLFLFLPLFYGESTSFPLQTALNKDLLPTDELDRKVKDFLERRRYSWRDMNISEADGQLLYDLIIKNNYTRALEIGTSTGHSAIWIAWALSKTGGKLITIEINERRYRQALKNFEEAGLSPYIEAILGDAHEIVPKLPGPFDFVFCDADKEWYKNYLIALLPKLVVGGCFTAHNVEGYRQWGIRDFLDYLRSLPNMETTIVRPSWTGISISYKRSEK
ncbi:MAG: class I SAM-dependent methyltransferase [Candidatus Aminicenantes bacterium]|nr:class I SAM-dependent methyltransferase [Candidatus Aminicenantes bacterium]